MFLHYSPKFYPFKPGNIALSVSLFIDHFLMSSHYSNKLSGP